MSDTHITEDKERNVQHYRDALADIKSFETAPDTIVLLGDITDSGSEEQYKLFEELTAEAGYSYKDDLTLVMGNHDQLNAEYDPEKAGWDTQYMRFAEYAGSSKVYYDRMVKGQHFICMGPDRNDSGNWVRFGFSDEQLSWLQRQLDADKAAGRVSHVFCHEPLSNTVHTSRTETWLENNGLEDNDALFNIVAHRPNVVFYSGHTHTYPRVAQPDSSGPLYINDGAVATGQIAPDAYGFDTFSGAFGWLVTVYQDRIAFQMRNFLEGEWVDDLAFEHPIRL